MEYPVQSPEQLGLYIRSLRKSRGLTQGELGKMLGVSAARVAHIERYPGAVGVERILEIVHLLDARLYLDDGEARRNEIARSRQSSPAGEW